MTQLAINGALCFKEMGKSHTNLEFVTKSSLTLYPKRTVALYRQGLRSWVFVYFLGALTNKICSHEKRHYAGMPQIKTGKEKGLWVENREK